ncbi:MAG: hypothetical protein CMI96_03500 [Pelagibacteraceae bacterium]|nr:hypothetical protein [Pelagibacteraceae bacterium]PPR47308.1 MAG: ATP phosphoribosyltransferase regulatory subunit [Alphaproteobacteria bacterium MarineAlpha5_Bin9]|tara:strand:- start:12851 stop:13963 length:1113 start_codon:yes stop_codon:yes gene_type:complete
MNKYLLPPGFKDELHENVKTEHVYKNKIIDLFLINGFELVKTPLIEYYDNDIHKNNFIFKDKEENKFYTFRDDITLQVARLANSRLKNKFRPVKLCYYGDVIRKKGTMLRPERQFLQVGAECIGEENINSDIEIIDLAYQSLEIVGIKNLTIELSSSAFLNYLTKKISNQQKLKNIFKFIKRKDLTNCLKLIDPSLHQYLSKLLSCSGIFEKKQNQLIELSVNKDLEKISNDIILIYKKLKNKHNKINFILDLTEASYFEYHTGIRFTFYAKNVRGEIARGGRYFTNKNNIESSTGFTCYMDTIIRASSYNERFKKVLLPYSLSENIKKKLIKKGYILETFFGDLKDIKKTAKQKKINYYLINNKILSIN